MSNRLPSILLAVALAFGASTLTSTTQADPGTVILCHASNPVSSLSSVDLKKALTGGTKQWANGAVVQVGVTSTETPELRGLASAAGLSASDLLSRIQQQVFKGEMRKPVILRSAADCIGLARSNPGALCAATAGMTIPPEAKVVTTR